MESDKNLKVVIASAGRRAHYVQWFREALRTQGISGEIIAMEYRPTSPSLSLADRPVIFPAYNSDDYADALRSWVIAERPDLFLSLNDYELQILSKGLADELRELGCAVAVLDSSAQSVVLDKYLMSAALQERGVPTPATHLGSHSAAIAAAAHPNQEYVVKHRFGSGSSGLMFSTGTGLAAAVAESATTALDGDGRPSENGPDSVVVQEMLPGVEYGVDGVFTVDGNSRLLGVLARRKDLMRGGDTDIATSVSAAPFREAMLGIGQLLCPAGAIDVDFRETTEGKPLVIDINPRLGGGYPFCHRAGADLPSALLRSVAGMPELPSLLDYELGITTARREEFTVLSMTTPDQRD